MTDLTRLKLKAARQLAAALAWLALAATLASPSARAADLTITAGNVKIVDEDSTTKRVKFGETVTQGQAVYQKNSDGKWWKADADSATAEETQAEAIVLTPGGADEYGYVVTAGLINMGATLTVGQIYVLSDVAGGVRPAADNGSGDTVVILGVATTSSRLWLRPFASGADVP
jgi:hypothetical protein